MNIIKRYIKNYQEVQCYRKNKMCCSCKHFFSFMGSAGYCKKDSKEISDMIDCMDFCKNGFYRYKPVLCRYYMKELKSTINYYIKKCVKQNKKQRLKEMDVKW